MSLFVTADLHFSFGTDKPMDIFGGWDNYVEKLTENWKNLVKPDDTIVIAGDISWGTGLEGSEKDFEYIHNLPGKKIILKGNHDYWFSTKKKVDDFLAAKGFDSINILYNNCYEYGDYVLCGTRGWIREPGSAQDKKIAAREAGRLELSLKAGLKTGKEIICFLHYPPLYAKEECKEIVDLLWGYQVKRVYYGHVHGWKNAKDAVTGNVSGIDYNLIACDQTDFCPVKIM